MKFELKVIADSTEELIRIVKRLDGASESVSKQIEDAYHAAAVIKNKEIETRTAPAAEEPKKEEPAARNLSRDEIKAYCAARQNEGVDISAIVHKYVDSSKRFRDIPDDKLGMFFMDVEAAKPNA
jgi:hypothetical protein